jgi:hypothetical protein
MRKKRENYRRKLDFGLDDVDRADSSVRERAADGTLIRIGDGQKMDGREEKNGKTQSKCNRNVNPLSHNTGEIE